MGVVGLGLRGMVVSVTRCQTNSNWDTDGLVGALDGLLLPRL